MAKNTKIAGIKVTIKPMTEAEVAKAKAAVGKSKKGEK